MSARALRLQLGCSRSWRWCNRCACDPGMSGHVDSENRPVIRLNGTLLAAVAVVGLPVQRAPYGNASSAESPQQRMNCAGRFVHGHS
jgi:hypothetical protein